MVRDELLPVRVFGILLIAIACISTLFFLGPGPWKDEPLSQGMRNFIIVTNIFYGVTGLGVVLLTRWGYILLKVLLYTMLVAFPIGTIISWWLLSHIRRNNLRVRFGFS